MDINTLLRLEHGASNLAGSIGNSVLSHRAQDRYGDWRDEILGRSAQPSPKGNPMAASEQGYLTGSPEYTRPSETPSQPSFNPTGNDIADLMARLGGNPFAGQYVGPETFRYKTAMSAADMAQKRALKEAEFRMKMREFDEKRRQNRASAGLNVFKELADSYRLNPESMTPEMLDALAQGDVSPEMFSDRKGNYKFGKPMIGRTGKSAQVMVTDPETGEIRVDTIEGLDQRPYGERPRAGRGGGGSKPWNSAQWNAWYGAHETRGDNSDRIKMLWQAIIQADDSAKGKARKEDRIPLPDTVSIVGRRVGQTGADGMPITGFTRDEIKNEIRRLEREYNLSTSRLGDQFGWQPGMQGFMPGQDNSGAMSPEQQLLMQIINAQQDQDIEQ